MSVFRAFEQQVLRLIVEPRLGEEITRKVIAEGEALSYEYTGSGYYLEVRHPDLPKERWVLNEPLVTGRLGEFESGFVVFIDGEVLTLECHSWGDADFPEEFRDRDVAVAAI